MRNAAAESSLTLDFIKKRFLLAVVIGRDRGEVGIGTAAKLVPGRLSGIESSENCRLSLNGEGAREGVRGERAGDAGDVFLETGEAGELPKVDM